MKRKLRIGIVGCGAIGSSLAAEICEKLKPGATLSGLYDIDRRKSADLAERFSLGKQALAGSLGGLIRRCDLVIEASSAKSSLGIATRALHAGCSVMIMSVGGIAADFGSLTSLARRKNAAIYIPSGALCGIDALKAVFASDGAEVVLTTTKHPVSFEGVAYIKRKNIVLGAIKKDTLLFCGSARKAIKLFPQNINVAALLSLAGAGLDKTKVRIIASPRVKANVHEVRIKSRSATISARTRNIPHPQNPKTSYLAVLSAIATLRQILEPVRIGT